MNIFILCGKLPFDMNLRKETVQEILGKEVFTESVATAVAEGSVNTFSSYCRSVSQYLFLILQKCWSISFPHIAERSVNIFSEYCKRTSQYPKPFPRIVRKKLILLPHPHPSSPYLRSGTLCLLASSSPLRQHWLMTTANVQLDRSRLCLILTFSLYSYIDLLAF